MKNFHHRKGKGKVGLSRAIASLSPLADRLRDGVAQESLAGHDDDLLHKELDEGSSPGALALTQEILHVPGAGRDAGHDIQEGAVVCDSSRIPPMRIQENSCRSRCPPIRAVAYAILGSAPDRIGSTPCHIG